jgi:hypothetical protein
MTTCAVLALTACSGSSSPKSTTSVTTLAPIPTVTTSTLAPVTTVVTTTTVAPTVGLTETGLIGQWSRHGLVVIIKADGTGTASWRIYRFCSDNPAPPCDAVQGNEIIDGGQAAFTIVAKPRPVDGAIASIRTSTDPTTLAAPGTVDVRVFRGQGGPGQLIHFPTRNDPNTLLCDQAALAQPAEYNCGA